MNVVSSFASGVDYEYLRSELLLVKAGGASNKARAFDAYKEFFDIGSEESFYVLSDVWLQYDISEEVWLEWNYILSTRFYPGQYEQLIIDYESFFSQRLLSDDSFRIKAVDKLYRCEECDDRYLLIWLKSKGGYAVAAYEAFKKRYPSLPSFDSLDREAPSAEQIKTIENFITEKNQE